MLCELPSVLPSLRTRKLTACVLVFVMKINPLAPTSPKSPPSRRRNEPATTSRLLHHLRLSSTMGSRRLRCCSSGSRMRISTVRPRVTPTSLGGLTLTSVLLSTTRPASDRPAPLLPTLLSHATELPLPAPPKEAQPAAASGSSAAPAPKLEGKAGGKVPKWFKGGSEVSFLSSFFSAGRESGEGGRRVCPDFLSAHRVLFFYLLEK